MHEASTGIEVRGVCFSHGTTRALDRVDLDVGPGVTGLLGPNGAGKTTLLKILATVLGPDEGRVTMLGHDLGTPDGRLAVRRVLGYVPQDPGFYNNFTAEAFVDYIAILKQMSDRTTRRHEVARVLSAVGLEDVARKRIRTLSGGMRQRLAVAQALLGSPKVLVLDEPTNGLDPEQRLRFREVISAVAQEHHVLLSTHQTEDVAAMCQHVAVIDRGRVLFSGTPGELTAQAQGRVWTAAEADPRATLSWRGGDGRHRLIGDAPAGSELTAPSLEDGYLLLVGAGAQTVAA